MAQQVVVLGSKIAPYFAGAWSASSWKRDQLSIADVIRRVGDHRPTKVEQFPQPIGEAGVMNSLAQVAKLATEGMLDPDVQAWSIKQCVEAGNPQTSQGRGQAILSALRKQSVWIPDPTNTETIRAAHLTLGNGKSAPKFLGGDCDDQTVAMLAAYLAACAAVDAKAAVVGHSYRQDRQLEHVLGSILGDDGRFYYVEPSSQVIPFGKAKKPTREVVILVPSQKKVCDDTSCFVNGKVKESMYSDSPTGFQALRHGNDQLAARPRGQSRAAQVSPAQQRAVDVFERLSPTRPKAPPAHRGLRPPSAFSSVNARTLGADETPPAVAIQTSQGWTDYLTAAAGDLEALQKRYHDLYDGLLAASKELGLPKFDGRFTPDIEADLIDLDAMVAFMVGCLRDAASGVRRLVLDGAEWGIERLAKDLFRLVTVTNNNSSLSVVMVAVKPPGETPDSPNKAPIVESSLSLGPLAIAGLVAAGLAAMGVHFLMIKTLAQVVDSALHGILQYRLQAKYIDCVNSGKCTPQQVIDMEKALKDAAVAMTDARTRQIKAQNEPIKDTTSFGKWLLVAAAALTGILAGYAYKDEIKGNFGSSSGGGGGSRKPNSDRMPATTRRAAGSRTPGGTMVSRY